MVAILVLAAALLPPLLLLPHWDAIRDLRPLGIVGFVDSGDVRVYFNSSRWVVGGGALYLGVPSEYPLLADLVFAAVRLAAGSWRPFADQFESFQFTWVTVAWWAWLAMLIVLWKRAGRRTIWLWLTPAALYFTLFRYDIFPVIATLFALLAARDRRVRTAAVWLGIAIALKGYALFFLPAFGAWVWLGWSRREAAIAVAIAAAPLMLSLGVVLVLSGASAMIYPFRVQAIRGTNGQSGWDVLEIVTRLPARGLVRRLPVLPFVLEVTVSLAAAALRPRTFNALIRSYVLAVGGVLTFSVFYSPQFALWLVPAAALAGDLLFEGLVVLLSWVTIAYFPVLFHKGTGTIAYKASVVLVVAIRSLALLVALRPRRPTRDTRPPRERAGAGSDDSSDQGPDGPGPGLSVAAGPSSPDGSRLGGVAAPGRRPTPSPSPDALGGLSSLLDGPPSADRSPPPAGSVPGCTSRSRDGRGPPDVPRLSSSEPSFLSTPPEGWWPPDGVPAAASTRG